MICTRVTIKDQELDRNIQEGCVFFKAPQKVCLRSLALLSKLRQPLGKFFLFSAICNHQPAGIQFPSAFVKVSKK